MITSPSDEPACENHKQCEVNCIRQVNFNSPKWFGEWIKGSPDLGRDCPYYKERISLLNNIKRK